MKSVSTALDAIRQLTAPGNGRKRVVSSIAAAAYERVKAGGRVASGSFEKSAQGTAGFSMVVSESHRFYLD